MHSVLSFPVGRSVNPEETNCFHFSFLGQSLCLGADSAFLLSSRSGSALAPDLELAVLGLRLGFFLESLPFRDFRPLPLAWSRLPLAKYFQSSRLAACATPKSWKFWRRLEPLHEIEEPVLFRHIKNVQGELRKMAFTYSRMGPVCFRLINTADHNRAGTLHSA